MSGTSEIKTDIDVKAVKIGVGDSVAYGARAERRIEGKGNKSAVPEISEFDLVLMAVYLAHVVANREIEAGREFTAKLIAE